MTQVANPTFDSFYSAVSGYFHQPGRLIADVRANMDIISSVANTTFLVGKLFPVVPEMITRTAFLCVNVTGFLYLDFQWNCINKYAQDTLCSWAAQDVTTLIASAAKTVTAVSDLFLMVLGCTAAAAAWLGQRAVQKRLYAITCPWGLTFLIVAVALDVWSYAASQRALQLLTDVQRQANDACRPNELLMALKQPQRKNQNPHALYTASQIRAVLDTYSWTKLQNRLHARERGLVDRLHTELNTMTGASVSKFGLRGFGYVALFISKAYPDTLIQAVSLCASSMLYTLHSLYRRAQQADTWS